MKQIRGGSACTLCGFGLSENGLRFFYFLQPVKNNICAYMRHGLYIPPLTAIEEKLKMLCARSVFQSFVSFKGLKETF